MVTYNTNSTSNVGIPSLSVYLLGSGIVSVYRILAEDSLSYTLYADQCVEHEAKCGEIFQKKNVIDSSLTSGSVGMNRSGVISGSGIFQAPLVAWGESANKRWKDLVSLVEVEDGILSAGGGMGEGGIVPGSRSMSGSGSGSGSGGSVNNSGILSSSSGSGSNVGNNHATATAAAATGGGKVKRRKPILLYFPLHNQPVPLGAYRSLILAERWVRTPHIVELLSKTVSHVYTLPSLARGAVSEYICNHYVIPLIRNYLLMEECAVAHGSNSGPTSPLLPLASSTTNTSGRKDPSSLSKEDSRKLPSQDLPKEFLQIIRNSHTNSEKIREFIQSSLDLMSFIQELPTNSPNNNNTNSVGITSSHINATLVQWYVVPTSKDAIASEYLQERNNLQFNAPNQQNNTDRQNLLNPTNINNSCWPHSVDILLTEIVTKYQNALGGNNISIRYHSSILLVLLLRILCNLRRIRPSELYASAPEGQVILDYLFVPHCLSGSYAFKQYYNDNSGGPPDKSSIYKLRLEFLYQCFRSLPHHYANVVYRLHELWYGTDTHLNDVLKIHHIQALLELEQDEVVEELVPQV